MLRAGAQQLNVLTPTAAPCLHTVSSFELLSLYKCIFLFPLLPLLFSSIQKEMEVGLSKSKEFTEWERTTPVCYKRISRSSAQLGNERGWRLSRACQNLLLTIVLGSLPLTEWINAEIVLSGADPTYSETLGLALGATGSMTTSDGGVTWVIGTIDIPEYTF